VERVGGYSPDTGDALAEWLGEFLNDPDRADVRRKLRESGAVEKHAFVIAAGFAPVPFSVTDLLLRDDAPLPTTDPTLPSEVSHVWAASSWATGAVFSWSPSSGWRRFEKR
jgi:hypothetical protein